MKRANACLSFPPFASSVENKPAQSFQSFVRPSAEPPSSDVRSPLPPWLAAHRPSQDKFTGFLCSEQHHPFPKSPATSPPTFVDDHNTTPQAPQTFPLRPSIPSITSSFSRYTQWHLYRQPICRWARDCRDSPRHCSVRVPSHPIAKPRSLLLSPYI
jgi:hypothetical protein